MSKWVGCCACSPLTARPGPTALHLEASPMTPATFTGNGESLISMPDHLTSTYQQACVLKNSHCYLFFFHANLFPFFLSLFFSRRFWNKRARLLQSLVSFSLFFGFLHDRFECDEIFVQFVQLNEYL